MEKDAEATEKKGFFDFPIVDGTLFLAGLLLFVLGFYYTSLEVINQNIARFVWCFGVALAIYALADSSNLLSRRNNIVAAIVLAFTIYSTKLPTAEKKLIAELEISAVDDNITEEINRDGSQNAVRASTLSYSGHKAFGTFEQGQFVSKFVFDIPKDEASILESELCPHFTFVLGNARSIQKSFVNTNVMSVDYKTYFNIVYKVDKNELYFFKDNRLYPLADCESPKAKEIISLKKELKSEQNVPTAPIQQEAKMETAPPSPASPAVDIPAPAPAPIPPSATVSAPPVSTQADTPAPTPDQTTEPLPDLEVQNQTKPAEDTPQEDTPQEEAPPIDRHIVGYVIFSQLDAETGNVERTFFNLQGHTKSRIPLHDEKMVLTDEKAVVRLNPFHWDATAQSHIVSEPVATLDKGQVVVAAGDSIIARDETRNNAYYVITPISSVVGVDIPKRSSYPPSQLPADIKGFVYLGYFDGDNPNLADKSFDNYSSPNAIYPAPNDILIARSDIWLRKGPRRWDVESHSYVKPEIVSSIHKGEYVRVAGDIVLSGKGIAFWAPISRQAPFSEEHPQKPGVMDRVSHSLKDFFGR